MKKLFCTFVMLCSMFMVFGQSHNTVDLADPVYDVLQKAEMKGYCKTLYNVRPYSESYVLARLDEIIENIQEILESLDYSSEYVLETELAVVKEQKERFVHEEGLQLSKMHYLYNGSIKDVPVTLEVNNKVEGMFTGGAYSLKDRSSWGYELYDQFDFRGDLTKYFSYKFEAYIGATYMPLTLMGTYGIGEWWYEPTVDYTKTGPNNTRYINQYKNFSAFPYTYKKFWDGNIWYFSKVDAGGLEGWAQSHGFSFGMNGEGRASFLDNKVEIGVGRNDREWGGMQNGSSLILNSNAHPFLGFDIAVRPFKWVSFSSTSGFLEFPNQGYINKPAYQGAPNGVGNDGDSYFYQNAFSISMLDIDFKYFHFDFGSACIWPKRWEFGYMFPFIDNIIYQDAIGDYDNLCLFGDIMFRNPGSWKVWLSGYLDEMPKLNPKLLFKKQRYMFALQVGGEIALPFLPFATITGRYTNINPYCYTHQAINYTPWYSHYICESYTNNGESLGYYLPPNSDEILVRLDTRPMSNLAVSLQYQLIRHGADYGSRQVPGSSLYSELRPQERDELDKKFLEDGCYEWTHIISLAGKYDIKGIKVPLSINLTCGYIFDYFTDTGAPIGTPGTAVRINTSEYPTTAGFIARVGFTAFAK